MQHVTHSIMKFYLIFGCNLKCIGQVLKYKLYNSKLKAMFTKNMIKLIINNNGYWLIKSVIFSQNYFVHLLLFRSATLIYKNMFFHFFCVSIIVHYIIVLQVHAVK